MRLGEMMEENKVQQNQDGFIRRVLFVLKRNLILILAVIFIVTGCGVGFSYIRNPEYTAIMRVSFSVEGDNSVTIGENIQYINTIVDFADEGVVVDRANAYYIKWVDGYKKDGKSVEKFCQDYMEFGIGITNDIYDDYDAEETLSADRFIYASSIVTLTKQNEDTTNWIFQIGYSDSNSQDALEKAYILVLAFEHELEGGDYFVGDKISLKINITNLGFDGIKNVKIV